MNFLEYIDQSIADMLADIKGQQEAILALEGAREFYVMYLEDCAEEKPAEKPKEAVPVQEAPKPTLAPIIATPEKFVEQETGRIIGDRRRKEFWTLERKAEASKLAKERWARRQKRPPVEERPRAEFKKAVIPALKPVTREMPATIEVKPDVFKMIPEPVRMALNIIEREDETLARIKEHQGKALNEPKPSWSGPTPENPDIVRTEDCPLSIAGSVLFRDGKYIAHLSKPEKTVLEELIKHFGNTVQRSNLQAMVENLNHIILKVKALIGVGYDIVDTAQGWKMVAVQKEEV